MIRALAAVAIALLALPGGSTPARPSLHVLPPRIEAGASVQIWGAGCKRGELVTVLSAAFSALNGKIGEVTTAARRNGSLSTRTRIPRQKPHGRYAVAVRCRQRNLGALAWLRIV